MAQYGFLPVNHVITRCVSPEQSLVPDLYTQMPCNSLCLSWIYQPGHHFCCRDVSSTVARKQLLPAPAPRPAVPDARRQGVQPGAWAPEMWNPTRDAPAGGRAQQLAERAAYLKNFWYAAGVFMQGSASATQCMGCSFTNAAQQAVAEGSGRSSGTRV